MRPPNSSSAPDEGGLDAELVGLGNQLKGAVGILRRGLDLTGLNRLPSFNTTEAYALYQKIFKPIEPLLEGVRHVFVVPDGALTGLPLGVLVTEQTEVDDKDLASYRKVPWLARKCAMSTLPSVSSLKALRTFAKRAKASRPFLGIGDPELDELARLNGCGGTQDSEQFTIPTHLEPENAEAGFRAMEGHALDETRKRLSVLIPMGGVIREAHAVNMIEAASES